MGDAWSTGRVPRCSHSRVGVMVAMKAPAPLSLLSRPSTSAQQLISETYWEAGKGRACVLQPPPRGGEGTGRLGLWGRPGGTHSFPAHPALPSPRATATEGLCDGDKMRGGPPGENSTLSSFVLQQ